MTRELVASWFGLVAHNALSLPLSTLVGIETIGPSIVALLLVVVARRMRPSRALGSTLLVWAATHFVAGGILSVLPIGLFPFVPDQSAGHYVAHAIYAVAQVPLLIASWRLLTTRLRR